MCPSNNVSEEVTNGDGEWPLILKTCIYIKHANPFKVASVLSNAKKKAC